MMLTDVWDYVRSLGLADHVYMAKLDAKKERSIGVYHSRHQKAHKTALGGAALESYGMKYVTFLVHWNRSPTETEKAAMELFLCLKQTRDEEVNGKKIKFIMPLYEIQDVGTDESGIYEMVIEAAVVYEKGNADE